MTNKFRTKATAKYRNSFSHVKPSINPLTAMTKYATAAASHKIPKTVRAKAPPQGCPHRRRCIRSRQVLPPRRRWRRPQARARCAETPPRGFCFPKACRKRHKTARDRSSSRFRAPAVPRETNTLRRAQNAHAKADGNGGKQRAHAQPYPPYFHPFHTLLRRFLSII